MRSEEEIEAKLVELDQLLNLQHKYNISVNEKTLKQHHVLLWVLNRANGF